MEEGLYEKVKGQSISYRMKGKERITRKCITSTRKAKCSEVENGVRNLPRLFVQFYNFHVRVSLMAMACKEAQRIVLLARWLARV